MSPVVKFFELTTEQAKQVAARVHDEVGYLNRLIRRMELRNMRIDDPVYLETLAARDAVHKLWVHLHYYSCGRLMK